MPVICVENLTKEFKRLKREEGLKGSLKSLFIRKYDTKTAVNNISFQIEKGEIIGYLGANGAGKSTTIKMLVGILEPTKGNILVNGIIPYKNRIENAKRMGVVFGQRTQLWWDIPVSESLSLMREMYKISHNQYKENIKLFSEILGLDEFINVPVRQLSLGQRMRADLCASLLHNPDILYLDEPTIGLDVVVKENIRNFIKEVNKKRETTIILTTHDMSDVEKLCSRVMAIDNGQIMYEGSLEKLKDMYGSDGIITIEVQEVISDLSELSNLGIQDYTLDGSKAIIKYDRKIVNSVNIISWFINKYSVIDFAVSETEIEEVVRKLYKSRNLKDATLEVTA